MNKSDPERLAVVETKVDNIASDVKEIKDTLAGLDNKYASKWVQSAVSFVIGLIVASVLAALLALVILKPSANTTNVKVTESSKETPAEKTSTGSVAPTSSTTTTNKVTTIRNAPPSGNDDDGSTSGGVHIELPKLIQ